MVIHTNVPTLRAHPAYQQAKQGDPDSALQLVSGLLKPAMVKLDFEVIVPVVQTDARKPNGIPPAAAFAGRAPGARREAIDHPAA